MGSRADILIRNADVIATCAGPGPRSGEDQRNISAIARGSVAGLEGRIVFVGSTDDCERAVTLAPGATVIDGRGHTGVPGFVDPHTHLVFAGDRRDELQRRLAGMTDAEIAAAGGGIVRTVTDTRAASEADWSPRRAASRRNAVVWHDDRRSQEWLRLELSRVAHAARDSHARSSQPVELTATFRARTSARRYRGRRADYTWPGSTR